ncbi:MAG TPA: cytochrome c [Terriglobia bacterium]|nr:cytochrome c [Terriglobia bacterium]
MPSEAANKATRWEWCFATTGILLLLLTMRLIAHDIITTKLTYTRDISRIFDRRCISCHGEGSSIPLTSYQEVRPWAVDIKEQVLARKMPPWGAVKGFGDLAPDHGLTQEEILIISAWVVGGAPQGETAFLPKRNPDPAPPAPRVRLTDSLAVFTRTKLRHPLELAGIKPQPGKLVHSNQIIARLPDGSIQPLLWLYDYDPKWKRVFRFRHPLALPAGTLIEASTPLRYSLETPVTAPSSER